MAGELKQHEHEQILIPDTRKRWPVSLLGCLSHDVHINDDQGLAWPWVLLKACACPATVLGANETLFQGEELADVGCLQPHSCSGPFCRELNEVYCGLGNEGLKLCASTCLLQALCSCACLGLPFVAWWTVLQRQRVVAKHGVDDSDEAGWLATAMFPCSLLQMHMLLHQQRQAQQQEDASAPLKPPKVQRMTATALGSDCLIQAPAASSVPGPLTSGLSASKVLRTVRAHPARSESLVLREQAASTAGSRPCDSPSSSSDVSDGVDSPYSARPVPDGISPGTPDLRLSAAAAAAEGRVQRSSVHGASGAQPPAAAGSAFSPHSRPAHGEHSSSSQLGQQPSGLHPDTSSSFATAARQSVVRDSPRASSSGVDGMPLGPLHQRHPQHRQSSLLHKQAPRQAASGSSRPGHARTMSAGAACGGSSGVAAAAGRSCTSPELLCNIASCGGAVGDAAAISVSQSCQLPACHSSSSSSAGAAPAQAGACRAAVGGASSSRGFACSSSLGRLQLSHEDAPLLAMKASPGRSTGPRGLPGPGLSSSRCAGLASSWQQRQSSSDSAGLDASSRANAGSDSAPGAGTSQQQGCDSVAHAQQEQLPPLPAPEESGLLCAPPAGRSSNSSSSSRGNDAAAASAGQHRTSERWGYMSELCNLGGSFEASSGLVAAMQQLAAEASAGTGGSARAGGSTDVDSDPNPLSSGSSSEAVHVPGAGTQMASAAAGASRLVASRQADTGQQQQQQQQQPSKSHRRAASGSWPDAAPSPYSTLTDASGSGVSPTQGGSKAAAVSSSISGGGGGGSGDGGSRLALSGIDRQMLAAVTGCSSTERLTASQEELAAKLAKLAFANPAAARQLAGQKPQQAQQQQQQGNVAASAGAKASAAAAADEGCCDEPFYPTMMSDVCNLAEPVDGADRASIANLCMMSAAQRTSLLQSLSGRQPQDGGKRSVGGAPATGRSAAGKLLPPLSSAGAAAGPLKSGLLLRSQQGSQQLPGSQLRAGAVAASSRASRPSMARLACGSTMAAAADGSAGGGCSSGSGGPLESFDSYYTDCSLSRDFGPALPSAGGGDAGTSSSSHAGGRDKTYTVTPGGMIMETPGVRELAAAAAAGAKATGAQQLRKQQQGLGSGGGSALPCGAIAVVTAAAAADSGAFGAPAGSGCREAAWSSSAREAACWQGVGSGRGSPPALVVGVRAAAHATSAAASRPKGPAACISVQTSSSLWPPPAADSLAIASHDDA